MDREATWRPLSSRRGYGEAKGEGRGLQSGRRSIHLNTEGHNALSVTEGLTGKQIEKIIGVSEDNQPGGRLHAKGQLDEDEKIRSRLR